MTRSASFPIVRFRHIELRFHISLIFLLAYVIFVAAIQFPFVAQQAGWTPASLRWGAGVWASLFAFGLLISIALHEFAHALTAQRQGIRVKAITLMMLGGISEIEQRPEKPASELILALIGPATSIALALILGIIRRGSGSADLSFFCYWLGSANWALGIFNLLPAFPLDGGRALRALLAIRWGEVVATQTAVKISRIFAWVLGLFGFVQFNLLLVLIAIFVYSAAQAELFSLVGQDLLKGIQVGEVLTRLEPVYDTELVRDAAGRMLEAREAVLPVQNADHRAALLSLERVRALDRSHWGETRVGDVMEIAPRWAHSEELLSSVWRELVSSPASALPVEQEGRVVGVVKLSDVSDILRMRDLERDFAQRESEGSGAGRKKSA